MNTKAVSHTEPPIIVRYRSATTHAAESTDPYGFVTLCGLTITEDWIEQMPHVALECRRCRRSVARRWPDAL